MFYRVILNARLALEMPHGDPITCGFVMWHDFTTVQEVLEKWPKMVLPKNAIQMVAELQDERRGVHFTIPAEAQPDDSGT